MLRLKMIPALALMAPLAMSAVCRGQSTLKAKFADTGYIEVKHHAMQEFSAMGMSHKSESTIRFVFEMHLGKTEGGKTVLDGTVLTADAESVDDGTKPDEAIGKTFEALKGQKFKVKIGKGNEKIEAVPSEEMIAAFGGDDYTKLDKTQKAAFANTVQAILLVHLMDAFTPLPAKTVNPGDDWHNTASIDATQGFMHEEIDRDYKLADRQISDGKRVDAINWTSDIKFEPLPNNGGDGLLKLTQKDDPTNEGTVLWDTDARRPIRIDCLQTYSMGMTLRIDGKTVEGTGKGSDTLVFKFSSEKPADNAAKTDETKEK